jgi:hypothetical protein
MRHETVTSASTSGADWNGIGYLVSIISVVLLGIVAWPGPGEPEWHIPVIIVGMAASIIGMALRYKAHLDQQRELRRTKAAASRS